MIKWKHADILPSVLLTIFFSVSTVVPLYVQNTEELRLTEALLCMGALALVGLVIGAVGLWITRSWTKASLVSVICMAVLLNFGYLQYSIPQLALNYIVTGHHRAYYLAAGIAVAVMLGLCVVIWRALKEDHASLAVTVLLIAVVAAMLISASTTIVQRLGRPESDREAVRQSDPVPGKNDRGGPDAQSSEEPVSLAAGTERPNIYLFLFDEYAGFTQIDEQLHFDNSELYDYLTDNGFTISSDSTNYYTMTKYVLKDLFSLSHLPNTEDNTRLHYSRDMTLFRLLSELGYDEKSLDVYQMFELDPMVELGDYLEWSETQDGNSIIDLLVSKSAFYPLADLFTHWFQSGFDPKAQMDIITDYFSTLSAPAEGDTPCFYVCYANCPHMPFVVNADGSAIPYLYHDNVDDPQYYLSQLQYVNTCIHDIVDGILAADPDGLVILMSDHGARGLPGSSHEYNSNILMAVYDGGEAVPEIRGLSGVNILRTLLDNHFDLGLGCIEFDQEIPLNDDGPEE